ncbi:sigma-70 family RNA polymerase sigma factor [Paraliomyxa miuraensis]|nr:sigma-70 family RNA polymerase sigma factor [Paraliomyxa miuraensis]
MTAWSADASGILSIPVIDPDPEFARLYHRHHGFVWRILRRLGVPPAALDDASQDVFVVVHRRRDALRTDVSVRSWLFGIARRVAADVHRGQRRRQRKLDALLPPPDALPLDDTLARDEAAAFVHAFLERLDDGHRMVFVLCDVEGLTAPEVAEALELNVNTVYSRLRKARLQFERAVARHQARSKVLHG